jgi:hypothetical protein
MARRVRHGRAFWEKAVRDFEVSGETHGTFTRNKGVTVSALRHWVYKYYSYTCCGPPPHLRDSAANWRELQRPGAHRPDKPDVRATGELDRWAGPPGDDVQL